jgi:hypothetical protein
MLVGNSIARINGPSLEEAPTDAKEARRQDVLMGERIDEVERAGQAPSLASVWKCPEVWLPNPNRHRPGGSLHQPFNFRDGTPMVAGQSH